MFDFQFLNALKGVPCEACPKQSVTCHLCIFEKQIEHIYWFVRENGELSRSFDTFQHS
jgi:hypothetical protein